MTRIEAMLADEMRRGAELERARIVALIREADAALNGEQPPTDVLSALADAIEAGEHLASAEIIARASGKEA